MPGSPDVLWLSVSPSLKPFDQPLHNTSRSSGWLPSGNIAKRLMKLVRLTLPLCYADYLMHRHRPLHLIGHSTSGFGRIPRNRNYNEPDNFIKINTGGIGYRLEHQFSDNWTLRNAFRFAFYDANQAFNIASTLDSNNRTLNRRLNRDPNTTQDSYTFTADLIGKFSTGSIEHQLLFGLEADRYKQIFSRDVRAVAPLDLFNPVYGQPVGSIITRTARDNFTDALGIYVQDQIKLAENLKLLLSARLDAFKQEIENRIANTEQNESSDAFSPRVGIVYQLIEPISLYASYSRSFNPNSGTTFDGDAFQPERGTQYEVGVKADLSNRLSATLAFYDLTRSNVLTADPVNPSFSILTGEQQSRGINSMLQVKFYLDGTLLRATLTRMHTSPQTPTLNLLIIA